MHSHHAVHLQVIYSAYPSAQLAVTPGMYPHAHVGEGKPDDNSRSVVGITHGLAWCAPRSCLSPPQCPPLWDAALCLSVVCLSALILPLCGTLWQIRNMTRRAFPHAGR